MKNDIISFGSITIYGYGLMIAIGIMAAFATAEYRARKMNLEYERIFGLAVWGVAGGLLGAKLLYLITRFKEILASPQTLFSLSNGFVVYGGILGGILAGFLFCKRKKLDFLKYFDLAMPSVALAQGFGRIGCFLAGCCYGMETQSVLGVVFHESDYAPNGVHLFPTQLISSGLDFLHFFVLILLAKRVRADGQVASFYLIFYSIGRFILEFYRGDLARGNVGSLSTSQFISVFLLILGSGMVLLRAYHAKKLSIR